MLVPIGDAPRYTGHRLVFLYSQKSAAMDPVRHGLCFCSVTLGRNNTAHTLTARQVHELAFKFSI